MAKTSTAMCKFCEAMESNRKVDESLKVWDSETERRYSIAIVTRIFKKGHIGCLSSSTDYRCRGCGYDLNFCPECGRKL